MLIKAAVAVSRFQEDQMLDKLFFKFEAIIKSQPYNGDMLKYVCDYTKSLKNSRPDIYNTFCYNIGYEFYFKQKYDMNGALEFLNYSLTNNYTDERILQDLIEVYTALGDQRNIMEIQRLRSLTGR